MGCPTRGVVLRGVALPGDDLVGEVLLVTAFDVFEAEVLDGTKMETLPLEPIASLLLDAACLISRLFAAPTD